VEKKVIMRVPGIQKDVAALLLTQCPSVLSIGRTCTHEGYSFHWMPGVPPYLVDPAGARIPLVVEGDIPYLMSVPTHPSPASNFADAAMPSSSNQDDADAIASNGDDSPVSREARLRAEALSLAHLMNHRTQNRVRRPK